MRLSGTDSSGNPVAVTTTTDANGNWSFTVPAGTYTVDAKTSQRPTSPASRARAPSAAWAARRARSARRGNGRTAPMPPPLSTTSCSARAALHGQQLRRGARRQSLAGRVYQDADYNNADTAGDPGIAGVTVALTGTDLFGNAGVAAPPPPPRPPATMASPTCCRAATRSAETQPAAFADGSDAAGTAGGTREQRPAVSAIALRSNVTATGYDFGELLTRITTRVFVDANNDGVPQAGDTGITERRAAPDRHRRRGQRGEHPGRAGHRHGRQLRVPQRAPLGRAAATPSPRRSRPTYAPGKANPNGHAGTPQGGGNVITGVTVSAPARRPRRANTGSASCRRRHLGPRVLRPRRRRRAGRAGHRAGPAGRDHHADGHRRQRPDGHRAPPPPTPAATTASTTSRPAPTP